MQAPVYREDWEADLKRVLALARPHLTDTEIHHVVDTVLHALRYEIVRASDQLVHATRDQDIPPDEWGA